LLPQNGREDSGGFCYRGGRDQLLSTIAGMEPGVSPIYILYWRYHTAGSDIEDTIPKPVGLGFGGSVRTLFGAHMLRP
jgi:hypothetical protein